MQALHDFVNNHRQEWLDNLARLTAIDCGTTNKPGVDAVGAHITNLCRSWGWDVHTYPQEKWGDCHTATLTGTGVGRIMLMGHLDTVYFDGTVAAHPARQEGNNLYLPGAGDMKGGLLTGMYALRALQQSGFDQFETLTFFFNSEEEHGSPVSQHITQNLASSMDAALVFEPARSSGAIVSARKASAKYAVHIKGLSAHAGIAPEKGINAVVAAAHYVLAAAALNKCVPGVTVTPTVVHGGGASNVVPEDATVQIDCRAEDPAGVAAIEQGMRDLAKLTFVSGAAVTVTGGFSFPPMAKTPSVSLMAGLARDAAADLDFVLEDVATGGASDANIIAPHCPVIDGLGPVSGNAHNADLEYIELDSIVPRTVMAALLIRKILQPQTLQALRSVRE